MQFSLLLSRLYLRWKVAVSTMILLDREKDSAVNNMRSGRYRGLKTRRTQDEGENKEKHKAHYHFTTLVLGTHL